MEFQAKKIAITLLASSLFFPAMSSALITSVTDIIKQSVNNTTIRNISVSPVAHSNAVQITITTGNNKNKHIIVSKNDVAPALHALEDPNVVGSSNASSANQIIQSNAVLVQSASGFTPAPVPGAAAIVTATVAASNQQASK